MGSSWVVLREILQEEPKGIRCITWKVQQSFVRQNGGDTANNAFRLTWSTPHRASCS
jgi:hypothetical protein